MNEVNSRAETSSQESIAGIVARLQDEGVELVRLSYCDMHGTARGKDVPLETLGHVAHEGIAFCVANLIDGLAGNPTNAPGLAPDRGYPDMRARPVLSTLISLPWEPGTAWCIADIADAGAFTEIAPRNLLKRVLVRYHHLGLTPVIGPELEFFLLKVDEAGQAVRYIDHHSMAYTVGQRSDPQGVVREMLKAARGMGLQATAANHEFCRGQFEINMLHGEALDAADRAFRFKAMVKEIAAQHGLLATFMGKPFNDDGGSGFHIHLSISSAEQANVFAAANDSDALSLLARRFLAGILEHAPALMAFLAPTINSYKRLVPDSLVPIAANWAFDNRTSFVRVPAERGMATRLEVRAADAAVNPYLAIAACLVAGLDGMQRELEPPPPVSGDVSVGEPTGTLLPRSLEAALDALRDDERLCEGIGKPLVEAFCAMKRVEVERYRTYITDWERNEYLWHL
ncbi:MAG TPA: glutamine synthetase family protein [Ktedonobacteraceae bacterium]|nr:glutamine synthetase family protein [Ktedonobacteraceae bacterium]